MLPMTIAQAVRDYVQPAIVPDTKITPTVAFPMEDGTMTYQFSTKTPVDLSDDAAIIATPIKSVKVAKNTPFVRKGQGFTGLKADEAKVGLQRLLEHAALLGEPVAGN